MSETPSELGAAEAVHWAVEEALIRERARIARDLHDTVAADLAGAIALFKHQLQSEPDAAALKSLLEVLESVLGSARELLRELRPDTRLAERSLIAELRRTAEEFERLYEIRVEVWTSGSESDLSRAEREVVFQIVREALTNVRRHSGSETCRVRLAMAARPFFVEVSDEGAGIPADVPAGYGLIGMRERAAGIGGRLEVVSAANQGTTIFLFGPEGATAV